MKGQMLYLIGEPGSGKSTLMAALVAGLRPTAIEGVPVPHVLYRVGQLGSPPVAIQLGRVRESFSGTDALGMAIQPKVLAWLDERPEALVLRRRGAVAADDEDLAHQLEREIAAPAPVLGEGDRLGNLSFLDAARTLGYDVELAVLATPSAECACRRRDRCSKQGEAWIKGRVSKVRRIAEEWRGKRIVLGGERPVLNVLAELVYKSEIAAEVRAAAEVR